MRTIRASEVSAYQYCQRAWWYQRNGLAPENQMEMAEGVELHARHGRSVMTAGCLRVAAYGVILLAVLLVATQVALRLLQ
jgi:CRISPR/Cas system-associated exonuclease Cas4 (RecB family)